MGRGNAARGPVIGVDAAEQVRRVSAILEGLRLALSAATASPLRQPLVGTLDLPLALIALDEPRGQADPDSVALLVFATRRHWADLGAAPAFIAALDECVALLAPVATGAALRAHSARGRGSVLRATGRYRQCVTNGCLWAVEAAAADGSTLWLCQQDVLLV